MANKAKVVYVCNECGYETSKWMGKCPSCGSWDTLEEDVRAVQKTAVKSSIGGVATATAKPLSKISSSAEER